MIRKIDFNESINLKIKKSIFKDEMVYISEK